MQMGKVPYKRWLETLPRPLMNKRQRALMMMKEDCPKEEEPPHKANKNETKETVKENEESKEPPKGTSVIEGDKEDPKESDNQSENKECKQKQQEEKREQKSPPKQVKGEEEDNDAKDNPMEKQKKETENGDIEEEEVEQHGHVVFEGPKSKEEQYHFDLLGGEEEMVRKDKRPHSAELLAEVMGEEILEMDLDLDGLDDLECNWISQTVQVTEWNASGPPV